MNLNTQKIFQTLAATSFAMGAYNTYSNVKAKELKNELELEKLKKKNLELQNKLETITNKKIEELEVINDRNNSVIENIKEILENNSNSSFFNLSELFKSYKILFDKLSFEQTLAIMNISGSVFIFISLISIITIFYGDYLTKYFKLEKRFPKLARFIQLRRQIKNVGILFNLIFTFTILIITIYINIIVFINY
jgi:hypothetical protein